MNFSELYQPLTNIVLEKLNKFRKFKIKQMREKESWA